MGEKVGDKLGEKVGEKTGKKVGDRLGEIHKLNLCNFFTKQGLLGKSDSYMSKYTLNPLLNQNMVILLEQQSQVPWISFTSSTELPLVTANIFL